MLALPREADKSLENNSLKKSLGVMSGVESQGISDASSKPKRKKNPAVTAVTGGAFIAHEVYQTVADEVYTAGPCCASMEFTEEEAEEETIWHGMLCIDCYNGLHDWIEDRLGGFPVNWCKRDVE